MKIVRKPIDVIAIFERGKLPMPVKARMELDRQEITIKVEQIIRIEKLKTVGKGEILYTCQSTINGDTKVYELKYLIDTFQWSLYKI